MLIVEHPVLEYSRAAKPIPASAVAAPFKVSDLARQGSPRDVVHCLQSDVMQMRVDGAEAVALQDHDNTASSP
jgi:hypothetical protein